MTELMKPILITCGADKVNLEPGQRIQAWRLYQGGYFKIMLDTARKYSNNIWILSAGYGLIPANAMIETYDIKMNARIAKFMFTGNHAVYNGLSLAGKNYAAALKGDVEHLTPVLPMGKKMSYAKQLGDGKEYLIDMESLPDGQPLELITPEHLYAKGVSTRSAPTAKTSNATAEMLAALKFVGGSLAKKELVAGLTHFKIAGGYIRGFNGSLGLCAPIALTLDCQPKGVPFTKAIQGCMDTVSLSLTPAGKLRVHSNKFKSLVECTPDEVIALLEPDGEICPINGEALLTALTTLQPFVGNNAAHPWSNAIKLDANYAYATNNTIIVQAYIGQDGFPFPINIPADVVKEMVRIKQPPVSVQTNGRTATFHYPDGRYIMGNLVAHTWPDFNKLLNVASNPSPINEEIFEALNVVKPFCDKGGAVFIEDGVIKTHLHDDDEGATYDLGNHTSRGAFQIDMLQSLQGVVETIDWSGFETNKCRCSFFGKSLRGMIVGRRM